MTILLKRLIRLFKPLTPIKRRLFHNLVQLYSVHKKLNNWQKCVIMKTVAIWGNILNFGMQAAQQNTDLQLLVHNRYNRSIG